jgi:hypothetical protein
MSASDREAADDDPSTRAQRRGAGRADADGAITHALRGPGQAGAAGAAGRGGTQGGRDRGGVAPACQDGPLLAQALQRPRPRRARGERAAGSAAGLPGGPNRGGDRDGAGAACRPRLAVRVLDARSPGRAPGRSQGDCHAPQPHRRDPAARGAAVAPGGDLVRPAGRSGLRQKRGRSKNSTPPRPRAASSSASTRWARKPARAIPAAGS